MMMNSQLWVHPIGRCCKSCGWRSQSLTFLAEILQFPCKALVLATATGPLSCTFIIVDRGRWMGIPTFDTNTLNTYQSLSFYAWWFAGAAVLGVDASPSEQGDKILWSSRRTTFQIWCPDFPWTILTSWCHSLRRHCVGFVMFCRFLRGFLEVYCLFLFVNKLFARLLTRPTWSLCAWRYKRSASTSAGMVPLGVCHVSGT